MILGRLWNRYAAFWYERERPESLAPLRITFAAALFANMLEQVLTGMLFELYALPAEGASFPSGDRAPLLSLFRSLRPPAGVVVALVAGQLTAALPLLVGLSTRPAAVVCFVIQVTLCDRIAIWAFSGGNAF